MKPRHIVLAVTPICLILAVQLAWWAGSPATHNLPPYPAAVVTQTGEVIPASAGVLAAANPPVARAPGQASSTAAVHGMSTRATRTDPTVNSGAAGAGLPARDAALVEANKVRHMITDYHTLMGQNPIGTNAEIMKVLMGGNPHQAMLGPPEGQSLNDKGELVDQWGTPYFFHQLSGNRMEIHSAGPDKIMGTADDIVVR